MEHDQTNALYNLLKRLKMNKIYKQVKRYKIYLFILL